MALSHVLPSRRMGIVEIIIVANLFNNLESEGFITACQGFFKFQGSISGFGSSCKNDHLMEDYEIILRVMKGGVLD
jgi:hypothetical protein